MKKMVIQAAAVIDGVGDEVKQDHAVIIENGLITAVLPAKDVSLTGEETVVDARSHTVMPGLIDVHVHTSFSGEPGDRVTDRFATPVPTLAFRSMINAQRSLDAGYTGLRDLASTGYVDVALRDAINAGMIAGPRMKVSGYGLTMYGGHMYPKSRPGIHVEEHTGICNTADEAKAAARYQIMRGVDVIKLNTAVTDAWIQPTGPADPVDESARVVQEMDLEMIEAACREAHKAKRVVAAHCQGGQGAWDSINGGVDTLEHGRYLTDEMFEAMRARGTIFVPTLSTASKRVEQGRSGADWGKVGIPWEASLKAQQAKYATLSRAYRIGVKIAAGSDAGTAFNFHGDNAKELMYLVEAGMRPIHAIKAATSVAAEAMGLAEHVGRLRPGLCADILVVDGDPARDITAVCDRTRVKMVIKDGNVAADRLLSSRGTA